MPRRNVNAVRRRQAAAALNDGAQHNRRNQHQQQQRSSFDQMTPSVMAAFHILVSIRLSAAVWSPISDCDEVYNYWEPLHFLLYGSGFQTWEYSPTYAIRSYAYIGLHYWPAKLFGAIFSTHATKITTFFFVRCVLAFVCASADLLFYTSVCKRFGNGVGRLTLCFQALGAGYFVSSAAFLPSSFAMTMTTFAFACWMSGSDFGAIASVAVSSLVGWPFAALLGAPIALDMVLIHPNAVAGANSTYKKGRSRRSSFFVYSAVIGAIGVAVLIACDSTFYGKLTLAPFNIVKYNIFTPHGPDLYGVAPLSYYVINLFLNWNVAAVLAVLTIPLVAVAFWSNHGLSFWRSTYEQWIPVVLVQLAYWLWLAVFFRQPHKEERFLYPIYSLLALSAALALDSYHRLIKQTGQRWGRPIANTFVFVVLTVFCVFSISRAFAQYRYFHAPFDVYVGLNERLSAVSNVVDGPKRGDIVNVCIGKEWYRYPSSFFLPDKARLQFVKSEFAGLLPKAYPSIGDANDWRSILNVTRAIPSEMNDMNKEEPSRYIDLDRCDYLIDLEIPNESSPSVYEPNYSADQESWTMVKSESFMIGGQSSPFFRAFYIPFLSERYCVFGNYNLLERRK